MPQAEHPDSDSRELVEIVGTAVSPEVSRFVGTVIGSPMIEASELVAEHIRAWRFRREIRHLERAKAMLDAAGMSATRIPLRTLAPLMEGGSLEDDDSMVERWGSLLANAAGGELDVPPSFPNVLRELEPEQARILDSLYDTLIRISPDWRADYGVATQGLGLTRREFEYHADNLVRLRLIRSQTAEPPYREFDVVGLTEFGRAFVRACRPPAVKDPPVMRSDRVALNLLIERLGAATNQRPAAQLGGRAPEVDAALKDFIGRWVDGAVDGDFPLLFGELRHLN